MSDFEDDVDETRRKPLTLGRRCRFLLEWFFLAYAAFVLRCLPLKVALWLGRLAGFYAYFFCAKERRVAAQNLRVVFGERFTRRDVRRLTRRTFMRVGQIMAGLLWAPRLSKKRAAQRIDVDDLCRELEAHRSAGHGVLLVTAHYNDWELICLALGFAGFPLTMVTEPIPNRRVASIFQRCRTVSGNRLIPPKFAALKLFRALRSGERVGMMCDVNGRRGRGGVWVDFFGLQIFNGSTLAEIARRTGSAVIFCVIEQLAFDRCVARVTPTILPDRSADAEGEVRRITQTITTRLQEVIQANPEPWMWTNKRWKRRPTFDRGPYPAYSSFKRVI